MPDRRHRDPLRVVVWNMKVGRGHRALADLRRLVRDQRPDALLLQEAMNYVRLIRVLFPAYRVYAPRGWSEAANCPVMVRRTVPRGHRKRRGWSWVRCSERWTYAKYNVVHPGRTWTAVRVAGVWLLSVHRAPRGLSKLNRHAGSEEAEQLVDWFDEHAGAMFAGGDMNHAAGRRGRDTSQHVARRMKGEVVGPVGIDHGIARGLTATCRVLGDYGSDHDALLFTLRKDR